jgi:hypothetical protein
MVDKSKQLIIRIDLYFGYIFLAAVVISILEIPVLAIWLEAAKYILFVGWLVLLFSATARMWKVKIEHDLTSDLQADKILAYCILIMICSSISYPIAAHMAPALTDQFVAMAKFVVLLNLLVALDVMAIGVLSIYCFDKLSHHNAEVSALASDREEREIARPCRRETQHEEPSQVGITTTLPPHLRAKLLQLYPLSIALTLLGFVLVLITR